MSVTVTSPASSTATPRQTRVTTSSAAQAYGALQQDAAQQAAQARHPHRHHGGKASALPNGNAAQASGAKPIIGGVLNILT